ncbi:1-phosphatidylinositol 4,5-bisphosphate phosphodiesterase delta-4 isoform X5 [Bufo gargarizans]|uniref:1-phosphatidylinositol 4,5-bisphosphate phosphodiesterase delta-4 isoform X5 n=1 Tax=Bufo gargarizans TaxID=30331 RepID=UPI001CF4B35E|nr:1-phosphatidylinositol 4,5-bisphosphate phosphodiesterase delta-4 isoform X5 [Bufo gargarizans]
MTSPRSARLQLDENLQLMQAGSVMRKVKSRNWKKQRYFKLQEDCMTIWYKSKKTGNTKSTFSISDIETVREGHQSEILQSIADEFEPELCFTIVFYGRRGNLDLVAGTAEEAQCWIQGLEKLIETVRNMDQKEILDQWICDWFQKADKNRDGRMNFKEVQDLLKMMNVDMNEQHAFRLFQMADKSESGTLEGDEFVLFYKALTQRDEVLKIFQDFSKDGKKLTLLEFVDFLRQEQQEVDNTEEFAMDLIARYEPSETAKKLHALSIDGFLIYLCSAAGSIFNMSHQPPYQDMTQPLCRYFISSSHNTYLIEDQLLGQSSVEGYIRALKRGCRCVEVDTWDGPNGEPIVYHGHTFTSKIFFKDVISAINKYAFRKSKDRLSQELSDCIIYCKSVPFESFKHSRIQYKLYEMSSFTEYKARKLVKEPGDLSMDDRIYNPKAPKNLHWIVVSAEGNEFVRHNAWQLTRVYPTGLRTDSSNYNPQDMWNVGCQMVALNFQTAGVEMDLNDGLFQQNGRCGYVLKPLFMRHVDTNFNPDLPQDTAGYFPVNLSIQVISAQQLPKDENSKERSIIDPLVRVEIFGVPIDQSRQETKYIENNGFNPMWYETLQFKIHIPELALVRFVVEDYDKTTRNDFIGQYTLPFKSIKSGYRHIHLLSKDGTKIPPASLFVYIRITDSANPVQDTEG